MIFIMTTVLMKLLVMHNKVNFGRGGVEGDPIHAQAQDYSGLNNANMATPA